MDCRVPTPRPKPHRARPAYPVVQQGLHHTWFEPEADFITDPPPSLLDADCVPYVRLYRNAGGYYGRYNLYQLVRWTNDDDADDDERTNEDDISGVTDYYGKYAA